MKNYYKQDEWKIIESEFNAEMHEASESIFSIGNGKMGQRAMFEEAYSGTSLQGSYIAGIYYPDKTRVGWWKNGYPEYFAKVLNSPNYIGMDISINQQQIDLAKFKPKHFQRVLDMQQGLLQREYAIDLQNGLTVQAKVERFLSREADELGLIRYSLKVNQEATLQWKNFVDGHVHNKDSNYNELFWQALPVKDISTGVGIHVKTNKLDFEVVAAFQVLAFEGDDTSNISGTNLSDWKSEQNWEIKMIPGKEYIIEKYCTVVSSLYYSKDQLWSAAEKNLESAISKGYQTLKAEHVKSWANVWNKADIVIEGDVAAQQAIRFNIFQLNQTYTGRDPRLNIGPKGFTGEKYGGSTYWDTEAYCIPFYLGTADQSIARQLLEYRYRQLPQAIANAEKLGFKDGAALYPMVTMNGEECHNEWEITFEEIHRNGAMAYAIYQYEKYTGDLSYRKEGGAEVLLGIARFWSQRVHWSDDKNKFVMHGVTGPNEYENNVNNNWYTNYLAVWCMKFAHECIESLQSDAAFYAGFVNRTSFNEKEVQRWKEIIEKMYFPYDHNREIFLQQDGFLDKELRNTNSLSVAERPINQHWSWDRILRSCFIKQADVLQGLFFFEDHFSKETLRKNFDFYEPMTVHESSLSPCIHAVQAAKLGYSQKAYELYLRTSRLDLDDYNHEVHEGLHITSMAGTWISIVMGFGGMRIEENSLAFNPSLPQEWIGFSFVLHYRNSSFRISVKKDSVKVELLEGPPIDIKLFGNLLNLKPNAVIEHKIN